MLRVWFNNTCTECEGENISRFWEEITGGNNLYTGKCLYCGYEDKFKLLSLTHASYIVIKNQKVENFIRKIIC